MVKIFVWVSDSTTFSIGKRFLVRPVTPTVLNYLEAFFVFTKNSEAVYPACRKRRLLGTYQLQSDC